MIIYLDGNYVQESEAKVSVFDHGLLYGDGVFEGIRLYDGNIFKCKEHIDRLYCSAKMLMLEIPNTKEEIEEIIVNTCRKNNLTSGYIRLVVTRGKGDLGIDPRKCKKATVFCIAATINLYPEEMYEKGMPIITASQRRNKATIVDPQVKSLNYLNNVFAKIEAIHANVPEALMLTHDGIAAECTGDNIFIVKDNIIYTPPVYLGILDGITRNTVIDFAKELGYEIYEKEFTQFNIYNADECFLTGTAAEVIPVCSLDRRIIADGKCGPITKSLLNKFKEYVKVDGTKI